MTVEDVDVAVIGAGAAGLSAAGEAAGLGARVALLDDNRQPGGQYFRQPPADFGAAATSASEEDRARFNELRAGLDSPLISYRPGATVWDVPDPLTLAVANGPRSGRIKARAMVIAAGIPATRLSRRGMPRGYFCGMGLCWECLVTVNNKPNQRACMTVVEDGMVVRTATAPDAS